MMAQSATTGDEGTTFVLGGARSGKSRYAESIVTALPQPWVYIATAEARDDEMAARIAAHKAHREAGWQTIEAPHELPEALHAAPHGAAVLVDCLTLWLSNLMHGKFKIDTMTERLEEALAARVGTTVVVSNEVGLGIVPDNALAREFRDAQGVLNQRLAAHAGRVILMVAGLPLYVKGSP
jgi:adenosylcobinamide kinase/adenosylcobinamide-phosphate guanylyltransferase